MTLNQQEMNSNKESWREAKLFYDKKNKNFKSLSNQMNKKLLN